MNYRIIIKNGGNCEIYNEIISAENENIALKEVIDNEIINAWDRIYIEEA